MAGDWIKWLKGLGFRSEVLTVARKLNVHRGVIALACMEMWEWADSETIDGHVRGATAELIDAKVCLPGFSSALESVGWLKVKTEGISIPNFGRHNGKPAKLRAMKTKRQNDWRADVDDSVDADVDAQVSTSASTREEKRREDVKPKTEEPPNPPRGGGTRACNVAIPDCLQTEPFLAAWDEWGQHRREKRARLTTAAAKRQLAKFAEWGEARAIAAIHHSVQNGWTGIFEPDRPGSVTHRESDGERTLRILRERQAQGGAA
ncbi:MAG: hypothetical protein KF805_12560 [Phycisphaeraceae bacterium]|nr:hypothetical protein [Phycisphaeraceae bacterium]